MNTIKPNPCHPIAGTWICRGETLVIATPKGIIVGKAKNITQNYIILEITESKAIITLNRIIWVKKK